MSFAVSSNSNSALFWQRFSVRMLIATSLLLSASGSPAATTKSDATAKGGAAAKAEPALKAETPKAEPTFKVEKPMIDSSAPKIETPPPQQSPTGYFIPPDVMTSGASNNAGQQPNINNGASPPFPSENAIPEFGKPLPSAPAQAMSNPNLGPGWGPGPASGQSNDEARVGRLEKAVLGSTYPEHDLIDRVEHLEEEVFKSKGSGDMEARLKKMETTVFGQSQAFGGQNSSASQYAVQQQPMQQQPQQSAPPVVQSQPPPQRAPYEMAPYPAPNQGGQPNIYGTANGMPPGGPNNMTPPSNSYGGYPNQYVGAPGQAPRYPNQPPSGYPSYGNAPQGGTYPSPPGYQQGAPYNPNMPRYGNPPMTGQAPYVPPPPQYQYGVPQQPYGYPQTGGAPPNQYRPPVQQRPPVQTPLIPQDPESQKIAAQIPGDVRTGDYFNSIRKFQTGNVARWRHFPVLIHLPAATPDTWRNSLIEDVKKWSLYVPLKTAADYESFVIDVKWENKLPPRVFGITRVEGSGAGLKVVIFLLRPTFYPADVPETTLHAVFLHELGHAIGLYGHSTDPVDVMFYDEKSPKKTEPKVTTISPRDLNTLKKVYSTAPITDGFVIQPPLEYSLKSDFKQ